ncbi:MAG: recombinase family protein [Bacteriovorax sp.]|nr:recombinase family protein [Bacteriovorax sp.]
MLIGYARISTADQNLNLQEDALKSAGCDRVFSDTASGATVERVGLKAALEFLREGDVLVVWRLDRLGRSLQNLLETVATLDTRKIGFKSLSESLDTTSSGGKFFFQVFGALSEFERNLIRERTHAGLKAARARGRLGGRPKALDTQKAELAQRLYNERVHTVKEIASMVGISKPGLYHYLKGRHKKVEANTAAPAEVSLG